MLRPGSEGIRENKDEGPGAGAKAKNLQSAPAKVSNNIVKQAIGPCHPLFWGSNFQESTHQQAQVKASRRDLGSRKTGLPSYRRQIGLAAFGRATAIALDETARARLRDRIRSRIPLQADGSICLTARAWAVRAMVVS